MPLVRQVNRTDCANVAIIPSPPDFLPAADDKHNQKDWQSAQAKRYIDKVMYFCQKESEEMIKKAKESNGWCYS